MITIFSLSRKPSRCDSPPISIGSIVPCCSMECPSTTWSYFSTCESRSSRAGYHAWSIQEIDRSFHSLEDYAS